MCNQLRQDSTVYITTLEFGLMPCPSIAPIWTIQIILVEYQSFWSGPNHFVQVQSILVWVGQIKLFWANFYNLDLSKMIWTQPKEIAPVQNDWYSTKMIWTVQNHFGPIEGQGIRGLWIMWIYEMLKFDN